MTRQGSTSHAKQGEPDAATLAANLEKLALTHEIQAGDDREHADMHVEISIDEHAMACADAQPRKPNVCSARTHAHARREPRQWQGPCSLWAHRELRPLGRASRAACARRCPC